MTFLTWTSFSLNILDLGLVEPGMRHGLNLTLIGLDLSAACDSRLVGVGLRLNGFFLVVIF